MLRRLWSAWILLTVLAGSFGLSAVLTLHAFSDHHDHDGSRELAGAALAHGHWHGDGTDGDHEHNADSARDSARAGRDSRLALSVSVAGDAELAGSALPGSLRPVPPTESPPDRPAGILLLHRLSLLRI